MTNKKSKGKSQDWPLLVEKQIPCGMTDKKSKGKSQD
jgi:hypothetical protein